MTELSPQIYPLALAMSLPEVPIMTIVQPNTHQDVSLQVLLPYWVNTYTHVGAWQYPTSHLVGHVSNPAATWHKPQNQQISSIGLCSSPQTRQGTKQKPILTLVVGLATSISLRQQAAIPLSPPQVDRTRYRLRRRVPNQLESKSCHVARAERADLLQRLKLPPRSAIEA